jgi:hypothetical protein
VCIRHRACTSGWYGALARRYYYRGGRRRQRTRRTRRDHFGTVLTQAQDRGQDRARSTVLSSTFALPKKGPQNLPDPLTRDWYNPGNFRFRSSCEGLVTRLRGTYSDQIPIASGHHDVLSTLKKLRVGLEACESNKRLESHHNNYKFST